MNNLTPIESEGQRVLTTAYLALRYETDERRIAENFARNQDRYQLGKHYFVLEGNELAAFRKEYANCVSPNATGKVYLWTEKGAWLHAKSLNTDKAWEAYETLVDEYYRINDLAPVSSVPASIEDLIIMQAQSVKELKAQVAALEGTARAAEEKAVIAHHRIDTLDAANIIGDPQQRLNAMVRKYAHANGLTFSKAWNEFVSGYNTAFHTNLKLLRDNYADRHNLRRFTIPQYLANTGHLEDGLRIADKMLNLN